MTYYRHKIFYFSLILGYLLTGCDFAPRSHSLDDPPYCALENTVKEAFNSPIFTETEDWSGCSLCNLFEDEYLCQLIDYSLLQNPTIKVSEAKIRLAAAQAQQKGSSLYPRIDLATNADRVRFSKTGIFALDRPPTTAFTYTRLELGLSLFYEFDIWSKNRNSLEAAVGQMLAAQADDVVAKTGLSLSIIEVYYQIRIYLSRIESYKRLTEKLEKIIELTRVRESLGVDSLITLHQLEKKLYTIQDTLEKLQHAIEVYRHQLKVYLGNFDCELCIEPVQSLDLVCYPLPQNLPIDLLAHRSDIISLRWKVESEAKQIGVARANFYPNINLRALAGFETIHPGKFLRGESFTGLIGGAIHLPIFHGGQLEGALSASEEEYLIAVNRYDEGILNAVKEVMDSISELEKVYERFQLSQKKQKASGQILSIKEKQQKEKVLSKLDILNSEIDLIIDTDETLLLYAEYIQAMLRLAKSLGGTL